MADPLLSVNEYPTDGVQTNFEVSFAGGYISQEHVTVRFIDLNGAISEPVYEWVGDFSISVTPAPDAGGKLRIYRTTPADTPLVNLSDGSVINEQTLDLNARQAVFLAAEVRDVVSTAPELDDILAAGAAATAAKDEAEAAAALSQGYAQDAIDTINALEGYAQDAIDTINALALANGASMVKYQQAGSGAVLYDVQSKVGATVSVHEFGAVGDGIATDDAALVAACTAAGSGGVVEFDPGRVYKLSSVTLPDDVTLDLRGATLLGSTNNILLTVGNRNTIRNGTIDCGNTKGATSVNTNAALYGVYANGKEGLLVDGVTFLRYRNGVMIVSSVSGVKCRDWVVSRCRFIGYSWSSTIPGNGQTGVYCGSTARPQNTLIGTFDLDWEVALDVCAGKLVDNYVFGGQYGFGVHKASNVTVTGNTVTETSRGISVQHQTRDISIVGNVFTDNHTTGIHMSSGVRNFSVIGNVVTGTHANDNVMIQAYYGCRDGVIIGNVVDSRFDQWDGGEYNDTRAPSVGIRTGQMTSNITIANNKVRGYAVGIHVKTSIYPSIPPSDPNYQNCGVKDITVTGNDVAFDYEQLTSVAPKLQFLQSNSYGIWVDKVGAWENASLGAWGLDTVEVRGNTIRNTNYPVVWAYTADTSGNPVAKVGLKSRDNRAASTIGGNAALYTGAMTGRDINGIGDSWVDTGFQQWTSFTPTFSRLTVVLGGGSVAYNGKYRRIGNTVDFVIEVVPSGGATTASSGVNTSATLAGMTPQDRSTCFAVDATANLGLGVGSVNLTSSPIVCPRWTARTSTVVISGTARV